MTWLGAALGGGLLALAFPKVGWSPLAWVALVPLLWVTFGRGVRAAAAVGWLAGFVFFAATLYWLVFTIGSYTNLSPVVSVGPVILLCAFLALFFAAFTAGCEAGRLAGIGLVLVAAPLWVVLEWVRTFILGGFPWVSLGYSQHRALYLIQFAELTGVYGVSALVVLINVVVYGAFRRWRDGAVPGTRDLIAVTAVLVLLVAGGWARVHHLRALAPAASVTVGFVQANVAQDDKWNEAMQDATLTVHERLTRQAVGEGATFIVWSEAAAPFFLQDPGEARERVLALARELGVWILVGSPAYAYEGDRLVLYNRVWLLAPNGEVAGHYDKVKLVPFGEYVPLAGLLSFVHKIVEGVSDFRPGPGPVVLEAGTARFGTLICYEAIFPGLVRRFVAAGADVLVNVTNDAWFGRTSAPHQHLAMAAVRTIENRVPLVRVANTGFSAMVDVDGTVRWRSELFEAGAHVETVRWVGVPTVYARYGDLFVYGCMALLAVCVLVTLLRPPQLSDDGRQPA